MPSSHHPQPHFVGIEFAGLLQLLIMFINFNFHIKVLNLVFPLLSLLAPSPPKSELRLRASTVDFIDRLS